jgi:hypothetical protein
MNTPTTRSYISTEREKQSVFRTNGVMEALDMPGCVGGLRDGKVGTVAPSSGATPPV